MQALRVKLAKMFYDACTIATSRSSQEFAFPKSWISHYDVMYASVWWFLLANQQCSLRASDLNTPAKAKERSTLSVRRNRTKSLITIR